MKRQITTGMAIIACVALCAVVWLRSAEVEDFPAEPINAAVNAEFGALLRRSVANFSHCRYSYPRNKSYRRE
jgi:hypothetical protein